MYKKTLDTNSNLIIIKELQDLILKENEVLSKMNLEDVELCFNELKQLINNNEKPIEGLDFSKIEEIEKYLKSDIEKSDYINANFDALLRVFDRMKNKELMLTDGQLKLKVGNQEKVTCFVSKKDSLISIINISILKSIEKKLEHLSPGVEGDLYFERDTKIIKELKKNFKKYQYAIFFDNFDIEFRAIFSNLDLKMIKIIDIGKLLRLNIFDKEEIEIIFYEQLKLYLDEFASVSCFDTIYNANNMLLFTV